MSHTMHTPIRRSTPMLITLVIMLFSALPMHADELDTLRADNARLQGKVAELEAVVAQLRSQLENLKQRETVVEEREAAVERMAGVVSSGELAESYEATIVSERNEVSGEETLTAGPVQVMEENLRGDWFVSAVARRSNTADVPPVSLFIQGWYSGTGLTQKGHGWSGDVETLTFTVDGREVTHKVDRVERSSIGTGQRATGKRTENRSENAKITLTLDELRALAYATQLEVKLARGTLTLQREQRAMLRGLIERIEQRN